MWRGMLNLLGLIFLGDAFPYFSLICKDEKKNQFLKCSSSADGSRDPSGPVGPNEEGSADPQPKCPHGTTKPPREQVWRKYQQLSTFNRCQHPIRAITLNEITDLRHIFLFMEDETFAFSSKSFAPKIRQNSLLNANVKWAKIWKSGKWGKC